MKEELYFADMHCHILPGVDDGSEDMEQSLSMLDIAYNDGIRIIVATPHYHIGKVKVRKETVERKVLELAGLIADKYPGLKIYPGQEIYYYSEAIDAVKQDKATTMAGSQYVLLEFSISVSYEEIRDSIYESVTEGYRPIIAHAERYMCLIDDPDRAIRMVEDGACIQINAGSVLGKTGHKVKKFCMYLLKQHMVHFVASDAHSDRTRAPRLRESERYIAKKFGQDYSRALFYENTVKILNNIIIE